jgi:hypothetical protein
MLNFSFVFGGEMQNQALSFGAGQSMAANAIWALSLTASFLCAVRTNETRHRDVRLHVVDRLPGGAAREKEEETLGGQCLS